MNSIQLLEILESIDIMSVNTKFIEENSCKIRKKLDSLRLEFDLDLEKEKVIMKDKNSRLAKLGYENIQSIIRINSLLNIFKIYLDMDILEKLEEKYRSIVGEICITVDLLKYNNINIRILMHNEEGNDIVSSKTIEAYKSDYIEYMTKKLGGIRRKDSESLSFIELDIETDRVLDYLFERLTKKEKINLDSIVFGLVKYFHKLLEIRITEGELENDFIPFLSIFDLGYRYLMKEDTNGSIEKLLLEYLEIIRERALTYLEDSKSGIRMVKDVDDFISYIDSIYDKDYTELKIRNNYPTVILRFEEEQDSIYGYERVEFYL